MSALRLLSPISFLRPERLAPDHRDISAWTPHVPFALWLVEALRPASIVELGTHTGVSYFAFCQAVQHLGLNARCRAVDTWLGDEHSGYYDESIYEDVRAFNDARYSRFSDLLRMSFDEAASRVPDGSVDLLHIDGCHTYEAAKHDFETWAPRLSPRAVVLLHDTNVRERGFGVFRLWNELRKQYPHFEFLHGSGLGVLAMGPTGSADVDALLSLNENAPLTQETRAAYERLATSLSDRLEIAGLRTELAARQAELERGRSDIGDRDVEIRKLRDEAILLQEQLDLLQEQLDRTAAELLEIQESTTWRATGPVRSILSLRPGLARGLRHTAKLARRTVRRPRTARTYDDWIDAYDTLTDQDLEAVRRAGEALAAQPLISVLMPVFDADEQALREAIESVLAQTYAKWELCIADDASTNPSVRRILGEFQARDDRVKIVTRQTNGGISAASNDALKLASGEWLALLDHDDLLRPHALFMVARVISEHPDATFVYSDEDKIDDAGRRSDPYFKPDWNRALFYSQNYLCHLAVFRRDLTLQVGGFRSAFDGAQDWDLFLRLLANAPAEAIHHVPHILYHWRASQASTAFSSDAKPYSVGAATRALTDRLASDGARADVQVVHKQYQRVRYALPTDPPAVTVVIPTTGELRFLTTCLDGLLNATDYPRLTVLLVLSRDVMAIPERRSYLDRVALDPRVRLLLYDHRAFNFSWVNNMAASQVSDELICFLNDDTEPIAREWLASMVGHVLQDGVGAVGAKLYYPGGTIQHAGVGLGLGGVADHLHKSLPRDAAGYFGRAVLDQDLSCVTAGCLLMRRGIFDSIGGFDEAFAVAFNDVDLCIRVRAAGWRIVWTPAAELYHHESISLGRHNSPARSSLFEREVLMLGERWGALLEHDPHYNPNLSLERQWEPAFPPRVDYPWRAATRVEAIDDVPRQPAS